LIATKTQRHKAVVATYPHDSTVPAAVRLTKGIDRPEISIVAMIKKRTRLIVRKGNENVVLWVEDIVYFYREETVIIAYDKNERKYLCNRSLTRLEEELDPGIFFRANRQYLLNIQYVKSYKSFEKVKLSVSLSSPNFNRSIIVSQETAPLFRKWLHEEN
jgi:DNA-binding LytR/AlgR family response regulator